MNIADQASKISPRSGTQSLQRAVTLLRALSAVNREGASATQLATRAGIERTTTHRMLRCLCDTGLVQKELRTKRYYLGPFAYELGLAATERVDLRALCRPVLERIALETEDTVFLNIRSGDDSVCLERVGGAYPVKAFVVDVGVRRPLGVGAGGMAILSQLAEVEAIAVLHRNVPRFRVHETLTPEQLAIELKQAQRVGHVAMDVVSLPGVRAIGAPICTRAGYTVGALSVAAVKSRMTPVRERVLAARLKKEALTLRDVL